MNPQQFEVWKEEIQPVLILKRDEFHLLGQERVGQEDIWKLGLKKSQKEKGYVPFYRFVNIFMRLSVNEYMNEITVNAYKGLNGQGEKTDDTLEGLLDDVLSH